MTEPNGKRLSTLADLEALRNEVNAGRDPDQPAVAVCAGPGCLAYKSGKIYDAFVSELAAKGLADKVRVSKTGCHGFCERGPSVVILPQETCYLQVKPDDVPEIVQTTLVDGGVVGAENSSRLSAAISRWRGCWS